MAAHQAHSCGRGQVHADQPADSCRVLLRPRRGVTRSDAERRGSGNGREVAVLATATVAVRVWGRGGEALGGSLGR
eukprot:scaffold8278_cov24-Phaeocystis_antarctica.AAC.1